MNTTHRVPSPLIGYEDDEQQTHERGSLTADERSRLVYLERWERDGIHSPAGLTYDEVVELDQLRRRAA
jgi:hypothetical protein